MLLLWDINCWFSSSYVWSQVGRIYFKYSIILSNIRSFVGVGLLFQKAISFRRQISEKIRSVLQPIDFLVLGICLRNSYVYAFVRVGLSLCSHICADNILWSHVMRNCKYSLFVGEGNIRFKIHRLVRELVFEISLRWKLGNSSFWLGNIFNLKCNSGFKQMTGENNRILYSSRIRLVLVGRWSVHHSINIGWPINPLYELLIAWFSLIERFVIKGPSRIFVLVPFWFCL